MIEKPTYDELEIRIQELEQTESEREGILAALQESEKHYRLLAENSTDMIWTATLEGKISYVSPSIEKLFGYSQKEGLLLPIEDYMTPETVETVMGILAAELSLPTEEMNSHVIEGEMYKKDGFIIDIEINATWVFARDTVKIFLKRAFQKLELRR